MRIAIDASRAASAQRTGVGWSCYHLLAHLTDVIPHDVRVLVYSDQSLPAELRPWPAHWEERVLRWRPLPCWSQCRLAHAVLRDRPDVLFVPAHVIPELLAWRRVCGVQQPALVTTIHDVAFRTFPETYTARERWYADHATRLAVRAADRIIVPTRFVARELTQWYGADAGRIAVVHHGVRGAHGTNPMRMSRTSATTPLPPPQSSHAREDSPRTILSVGRLERKKNVARIIAAFDRIAAAHPDTQLILVGPDGHGAAEVHATIAASPFRTRIVTPGWVDTATYHMLLSHAAVLCFPTLAEGFGLPILEAMAAGVPVITSRGGAHEEVAGDAAILVDPTDRDAISDAIARLVTDDAVRNDCVRRGRQRAAQFTWERTALATWEALRPLDNILV